VVGLGNPGARYAETRHNVGFAVCERLAADRGDGWRPTSYRAEEWTGNLDGVAVVVVRPQNFVNESGPAANAALARHKSAPERLIVVHDDLDLAFGKLRVRRGGSAGGHRGVQSIIDALGAEAFLRVKIGLGRPPAGVDPATYVLEPFRADERPIIDLALDRAAQAVRALLRDDVEWVMQEYNR
jgi:PTH1 family peptidyl-tRNA hydrolase